MLMTCSCCVPAPCPVLLSTAALDPVAGAAAVLALAAAVTTLTVKAMYNKEQVAQLGKRMKNITPIVQVRYCRGG